MLKILTALLQASLAASVEVQSLSWANITTAPWIVQVLLHVAIDLAFLALAASLGQIMTPMVTGDINRCKVRLAEVTEFPPILVVWLQTPFYALYTSSAFYMLGHFISVVAQFVGPGWEGEKKANNHNYTPCLILCLGSLILNRLQPFIR